MTWIWLGALIVFFGGLIAIWPPPAGATRTGHRGPARRASRASSAGPDGSSQPPRDEPEWTCCSCSSCWSLVVLLIAAPLRARARRAGGGRAGAPRRADLEAAKEAKYREIRDAELDYRTGKLARRTGSGSTRRCARRRSTPSPDSTRSKTGRHAELHQLGVDTAPRR